MTTRTTKRIRSPFLTQAWLDDTAKTWDERSLWKIKRGWAAFNDLALKLNDDGSVSWTGTPLIKAIKNKRVVPSTTTETQEAVDEAITTALYTAIQDCMRQYKEDARVKQQA